MSVIHLCDINCKTVFKASSKTLKLTTWLCCAAVHCIVDQLLARLAAVRTLYRLALNRLALDAHGILVTNTGLTVTCPSLAQLFKRNTPIQIHTSYSLLRMHEHKSSVLTCLGFPSGPTQAERQSQTAAGDVWEKNISKPSKIVFYRISSYHRCQHICHVLCWIMWYHEDRNNLP